MKHIYLFLLILLSGAAISAQTPDANTILKAIDKNMVSTSSKVSSRMIIHSRRASRTVASISFAKGNDQYYSEYTDPPRERGTKMLKLDDKLWIYEPSSDRTIQISGNMLKQSVMGSDLSYEDFMEEAELHKLYSALVEGDITYNQRSCWVLKLTAIKEGVTYPQRKIYVDKEKNLALYEELYAKSGKLLKSISLSDISKIGNRWYPKKMLFKDELKDGKGTELIIDSIEFDLAIPERYFNRSVLKK